MSFDFRRLSTRAIVAVAITGWLAVTGAGIRSLMVYAYTPGQASTPPPSWPAAKGSFPSDGASLLVMFVHPQCPCSRASVHELASLMTQAKGRLHARVYVYRPAGAEAGWERTDLWRSAAAIPGVEVLADNDGAIAATFDAQVSGETQVYGPSSSLVFSGGITPARGHQGDSDGRRMILTHLDGRHPPPSRSPVFGCYLRPSTLATSESR